MIDLIDAVVNTIMIIGIAVVSTVVLIGAALAIVGCFSEKGQAND